jgi:hypothetical protein
MDNRFDIWNQERRIVIRVPGYVQIDFVKNVAGHGQSSRGANA